MVNVSETFLAELAKSNSPVLNQKPLKDGDYDISFEQGGYHFEFSQKDGYWKWSWNAM